MDDSHWYVNSNYKFVFPSSVLHQFPKTVFALSFWSNVSISKSAPGWLLAFVVLVGAYQIRKFSLLDCLSKLYAHGVFSLEVVNEGFNGFPIFCGIRWALLGEYRVFSLVGIYFESLFLCGVGFPVSIPGSAPSITRPSLLLHLCFVPHGDVLDICTFSVIMLRRLPSCSF